MALDAPTIAGLAEHLETCELQARDTPKITDEHPGMDWDDAYAIQDEILRRKLVRGARLIGLKAGLTSHAKMKQMGVDTPVFGFLVDSFSVPEGGEVRTRELIHPKVEPEIAFVLKRALKGPGCHIGAVLAATEFVLPGIEVIDSRYRDFKFDLKSVVADNTSAARFVVAQGDRLNTAHKVREGRIDHQVFEQLAMGGADELDTTFSNRARCLGFELGADFVDDDDFWHVVFDGFDHDRVLFTRALDLHAAGAADPGMGDVAVACDFV
jgi:2-keto-4-pentenoate hydratase